VWETLFPGVDIRVLGASPMFKLPGCREICLWMGAVDAGRRTAERVLKRREERGGVPRGKQGDLRYRSKLRRRRGVT
jgi:hypothetical protein